MNLISDQYLILLSSDNKDSKLVLKACSWDSLHCILTFIYEHSTNTNVNIEGVFTYKLQKLTTPIYSVCTRFAINTDNWSNYKEQIDLFYNFI